MLRNKHNKRILAIVLAMLVASGLLVLTWVLINNQKPVAIINNQKPVAIISAMQEELQPVIAAMSIECEGELWQNWTFYEGELYGKHVVAMICGAKTVNGYAATSLLIENFEPQAIIFTGISGALGDCKIGDVVISLRTAYHDNRMQMIYFEADNELVELAIQAGEQVEFKPVPELGQTPIVKVGTILSGDQFSASSSWRDWLSQTFDNPCAVDMQSAAIAQAAYMHGVPWVVVRCNSDNSDDSAHADIQRFANYAENNAAAVALKMVEIWTEVTPTEEESTAKEESIRLMVIILIIVGIIAAVAIKRYLGGYHAWTVASLYLGSSCESLKKAVN